MDNPKYVDKKLRHISEMMLTSALVFGLAAWAPQPGARPAVLSHGAASRSCIPLASADAESALSTDALIEQLRKANAQQVQGLLAENIRSIDQSFWMRVADLADAAPDNAERDALADFASMIAREVESMIAQAEQKLDTDAVSVQEFLKVIADADGQFTVPIPEERIQALREELQQRPGLDDGFVATIKVCCICSLVYAISICTPRASPLVINPPRPQGASPKMAVATGSERRSPSVSASAGPLPPPLSPLPPPLSPQAYMKKADEDALDDVVEVLRQILQVCLGGRVKGGGLGGEVGGGTRYSH